MIPILQSLIVFAFVTVLFYSVLGAAHRHRAALEDRITELKNESGRGGNQKSGKFFVASRQKARRTPHRDEDAHRRCQTRLIQAGIYHSNAFSIFLIVKYLLMLLPVLLGAIAALYRFVSIGNALILGGGAGGIGMLIPEFWLNEQIRRRHTMLRRSLPDFLDLMIICVEGGLSIQAAIQRVSDELRVAHPVLAGEFLVAQRDIELGSTVDTALRRLSDRTGFEGVKTLATFIREAQRFGSELSGALREHAEMLRNQRELMAEETAQKASVKVLFPMLLFIMPAVFVVLVGPAAIQIMEVFGQ